MKEAMKAKNEGLLRGLRAIKAEIIKAKTEPGAGGEINEETEQKFLQKMMKQRKDSLEIFEKQGREDLAVKEREEIALIEKFLPKQLDTAAFLAALHKRQIAWMEVYAGEKSFKEFNSWLPDETGFLRKNVRLSAPMPPRSPIRIRLVAAHPPIVRTRRPRNS